jgi:subtilisin family serine protease
MKTLLKLLIVTSLLATVSQAAVAKLQLIVTNNTIKLDTTGSVGTTTVAGWHNGKWLGGSLTSVPMKDGTYKFFLKAKDSSGTKYMTIKKTFLDGKYSNKVNKKPIVKSTITVSNSDVVVSIASSFDPDGSISKYAVSLWKDRKIITSVNSSSITKKNLQPGKYKIFAYVMDNMGKKSSYLTKYFTIDGDGSNPKPVPEKVVEKQKPIADFIVTRDGNNLILDASKSYDPDGGDIKVYSWNVYRNYKRITSGKTKVVTLTDVQPGNYLIYCSPIDDEYTYSTKRISYVVKELPKIVTPEPIKVVAGKPNYTLGTAGTKDTNSKTDEYYAGHFLSQINADAAYSQGWTGKGVKVAIIDTGIDATHSDLKDNIKGVFSTFENDSGDDLNGHGTHVAGIIGATKNGTGMHGVAYNADLISVRVLNANGRGSLNSVTKGIKIASEQNAKVANLSLGATYWNTSYYKSNVEDIRGALKSDTSLIFAAGNNGGQCKNLGYDKTGKCNYPAALPAFKEYSDLTDGTYDGAFIAVGAISNHYTFNNPQNNGGDKTQDNSLTYYSNAAGITKDWYIVAPGGDMFSAKHAQDSMIKSTKAANGKDGIFDEGEYNHMQGTSMAAPVVTGAFALLAEKFPYLKGREIRDVLFATTTDLGEAGVDEIYGHGLLNLEKAMKPIGTMNIPTGGYINSTSPKFDSKKTVISSSSAFGNSLMISTMSSTLILDDFNRGYTLDMTQQVGNSGFSFDPDSYQKMEFPSGIIVGLDEGTQSAAIGTDIGGFKLMYSQSDDVFGATGEGAMAISGKTQYLTIDTPSFKGLTASITYGKANANVSGMFTDISTVTGTAIKLAYNSTNFTGGIKLPMRIASGTIQSTVPTARGMDGDIQSTTQSTSLVPNGQEVSVYSNYTHKLTDNSSFELTLDYTQDSMNIAGLNSGTVQFNHITTF